MQPGQLSSGDVIADRRADYARMLEEAGDPAAAAELMEQALELVPGWAAGWFRLGELSEKAGDATAAAQAFRKVLELEPGDVFGASLKLALAENLPAPTLPPSRYVERLFDDYADRFDTALVGKLDYNVPEQLAALIETTGRRYACAVDLGCGTGLLGPYLRPKADRLEGYDLSRNMLAKAAEKHLYDHLGQADLSRPPSESGLFREGGEGRADLVTAADVFMYLGNLENAFQLAAALAAPGADFAFSVEDAGANQTFQLAATMRYRHGKAYVEALCEAHGFNVAGAYERPIRKDGGESVQGILFLSRKDA